MQAAQCPPLSCGVRRRRDGLRGVAVLLRAKPDSGAVSPAAILRRRHRCEGTAPLSARYPAGVGAATEFAGCFNRIVIPAVVIGRVIVRRVGVHGRRVWVALVVWVGVERRVSGSGSGFRLSRGVSTLSVTFSTLSGVLFTVSGVKDLLFDTQCTFRPSFRGISALSGGFDTLGTLRDPPSEGFRLSRTP